MPDKPFTLPTGSTSSMTLNALPETFVDHAEEIWGLLAEDTKQAAITKEIGWTLDKVKKYCAFKNISPVVWGVIVPTVLENVTPKENDHGTKKVPIVTENLLRNILDLCEYHQLEVIKKSVLIAGGGSLRAEQHVKGLVVRGKKDSGNPEILR